MKSKYHRILSLIPVAAALAMAGSAQAALTISATEAHGYGPTFGVSTSDLVNMGSSALTGTTSSQDPTNWGTSVDGAHDGINAWGTNPNTFAVDSGSTLTFDLGGNAAGYDITSIMSYTGYSDGADRISQQYNVEYSLVGSSDWVALAGDAAGATVQRPWVLGGGDLEYRGELKVEISDIGLTGVDQLRFTFANYPEVAVYTEIDVLGTATAIPEPTAALLGGLGLLTLLRRRR